MMFDLDFAYEIFCLGLAKYSPVSLANWVPYQWIAKEFETI
jgi:hypothetical protein